MPARRPRLALVPLALVCTFACTEPADPPPAANPAAAAASAAPATSAESRPPPRLLPAPAGGDVAAIVREEAARGEGTLVVSVGASWCEPCRVFHEAVQSGRLDQRLAGVRFLEFDVDRDRERLEAAGYRSRFVPLFALPDAEGRASGKQIQGGIKGPQAVEHIMARLSPLLTGE